MSAPPARPTPSDDGANQVWGLISTLVAGPAVWGAAGYGIDALADTGFFLPFGVVVGFVASFYIVYVRTNVPPVGVGVQHQSGSELPPRDAARPEPGDVR